MIKKTYIVQGFSYPDGFPGRSQWTDLKRHKKMSRGEEYLIKCRVKMSDPNWCALDFPYKKFRLVIRTDEIVDEKAYYIDQAE